MGEYAKAWQCIGCGKIEAPQTCIGVGQDRKAEFVYAFEHEQALSQLQLARRQANTLGALVRRLANVLPDNQPVVGASRQVARIMNQRKPR